jgi:hypothetical protein
MRLSRRALALTIAAIAAAGGIGLAGRLRPSPGYDERNVKGFGARGDGRHDDAEALQRAIDQGGDDLWFPAGEYRLGRPLHPRSRQRWRGDGPSSSVLVYGGAPERPPFNLVHAPSAALDDFSAVDLGFRGGRSRQLSHAAAGQDGFALYLRGPLRRIAIRNCRFEHFGDGRNGGGGIVLGPVPGQPFSGPGDIRVDGCVFADNGNMPGIYVSAGDHPDSDCGGIRIRDNSFSGCIGSTKVQNAIYVLGGGEGATVRHVDISRNRFDFTTFIDAAIELNWVDAFTVEANTLHFQAVMPGSTGILIRDGSAHGAIVGNIITSATAEASLRGILVLNFRHPGRIHDLVIAENVISGVSGAIAADRGSDGVVIANNRIVGRSDREGFGIRVVDAQAVLVSGNMVAAMAQAVVVGHGDQPESALRDVVVERNRFSRCGAAGQALIGAVYPPSGLSAVHLAIRDNSTVDTLPGSALIDPALLATVAEL